MNKNIIYDYDRSTDVLYASMGEPIKAKSVEFDNGIILRIDIKSGKYIGFTILDYKERLKRGVIKNIPHFGRIELPKF